MNKEKQKIDEVLARTVEQVLPGKESLAGLMAKRKIKLYLGIDPTSKKLHLGHTVTLRKLQEFADLGHEAILVIGTGTVLSGDPSLRDSARPRISEKEIKENIKNWKSQAGKVLDFSKVRIRYNGDWLLKLGLKDIINIASNISAIKLFQRDMFQRRVKAGDTVWTHEALYPLLQGYDSVALDTDLEIGGRDQIFNMLIGRELQQKMKNREKYVMTLSMIVGTDGKPMSKTSGNCIWLEDSADQMFGKIMSIPDNLIFSYFEMLTRVPLEKVKKMLPLDAKTTLAKEIVSLYHGIKSAENAEKEFQAIFRDKKAPAEIPEFSVGKKEIFLVDLLIKTGLASSKSEAKRLVGQGGVKINNNIQKDWQNPVKIKAGDILQAGKRRFVKIA